jgi:molecular chaperone GrpE
MSHSADDPKDELPLAEETGRSDIDLAGRLAAAEDEAREFRDRWVRERADLENLKKRAQRERSEAVRYGAEQIVRDLLPMIDDLERAVQAAQAAGADRQLLEGVALVLKAFLDMLARHGVERVPGLGERFDPNHHEAVAHVESPDHEPGMVIEEHRGGYRLHDRLLRAAMVTVSKGPSADPDLANAGDHD